MADKNRNSELVKRISAVGMFSALAFALTMLCKLIPDVAGFLALDAKDAVIVISAFVYGPLTAPLVSLITSLIEFIVTGGDTLFWGFLMDFLSSAAFTLTASIVYKYKKTYNGAIFGLGLSVVVTTAVMILLDIFIIPLYTGATRDIVISMIPGVLLPFNFAKTLMNSALALLLYKPTINAMRMAHLVPKKEHKTAFTKSSLLTIIISAAALIVAAVILIIIW